MRKLHIFLCHIWDGDGNGTKQQINLLKVSLSILMLGNNPLVPELIAGCTLQFVCWVVV